VTLRKLFFISVKTNLEMSMPIKRKKRSVLVDVRSSKMVYVTRKSSLLNVQRTGSK